MVKWVTWFTKVENVVLNLNTTLRRKEKSETTSTCRVKNSKPSWRYGRILPSFAAAHKTIDRGSFRFCE